MDNLNFMDAESLLATAMAEPDCLVEGLLPQGITLLCGAPKTGKSWLALWLALQIAGGHRVWDCKTQRAGVLYLCLEDTFPRLRSRLDKLCDSAPETLHLAVESASIANGLLDQLENYLFFHTHTKLIIIDTLQRVRSSSGADKSLYSADYAEISALKAIADAHKISILLIHHLRKSVDESDPFNMISGSTGLTGAVDASLVLRRRARDENTAVLSATGRDIEYQSLTLEFKDTVWLLKSRSAERSEEEDSIPPFITYIARLLERDKGVWTGTATELAETLNKMGDAGANPLSITKQLAKHSLGILKELGIGYNTTRTKSARQIGLYSVDLPEVKDFFKKKATANT